MNKHNPNGMPHTTPRQSATFTQDVNSDIRRAAATGIYDIRGGGAKRKVPSATVPKKPPSNMFLNLPS